MARLFGTDGVRGLANDRVTVELALRLGQALVTVLASSGRRRPAVVVGRDPRWSGEMLEAALVAGITSAGGDAVAVGVLPTPGVAHLTVDTGAAAGAVISASHNPMADNGIKFFGGDGFKLSELEEAAIEEVLGSGELRRPTGAAIGRRIDDAAAAGRYVAAVVETAESDLGGLHVVVDAANGAASQVAGPIYRALGARVELVHCSPDGRNINDGCGSTHPEVVAEAVRELGADVGIAHDGDADRLIAATAEGEEVDGDVILAVLAREAAARGRLPHRTVATTVMTNLGFRRAMTDLDIDVVTTPVGDRYVLQAMRERGLALGGEQSGHLIQLDKSTTGDGICSAVALLGTVRREQTPLSELAEVMQRLPQVLVNVEGVDRDRLADAAAVEKAVEQAEAELGDDGRVLVRASGTEPVVRVMVEATSTEDARHHAATIAAEVRGSLGF